jgi:hypothetical protein
LVVILAVSPIGFAPALRTEANIPPIAIAAVAPEITSTSSEVPPSELTKPSSWWEKNREPITAAVIKVFGVTSKALEMVPLAEPAAKAFEHAKSVLEEIQVSLMLGKRSPVIYTDERAKTTAILGKCRCRTRSDSANEPHHRHSRTMRAAMAVRQATANQHVAGVSALSPVPSCELTSAGTSRVLAILGVTMAQSRGRTESSMPAVSPRS